MTYFTIKGLEMVLLKIYILWKFNCPILSAFFGVSISFTGLRKPKLHNKVIITITITTIIIIIINNSILISSQNLEFIITHLSIG